MIFCPECGAEGVEGNPGSSALETWHCAACGHEFHSVADYAYDYLATPPASLFLGRYVAADGPLPAKAFLLLKRLLASHRYFQLDRLEAQYLDAAPIWHLGRFCDAEAEALRRNADELGLSLIFVADEPM